MFVHIVVFVFAIIIWCVAKVFVHRTFFDFCPQIIFKSVQYFIW
jgi:hypothetical protein